MGRDFPPVQTGPGVHPASCTMGPGSFPGVKYGRGVLLTTHPLLVPRSWKIRAILLSTLWATTRPVTGAFYLLPLPSFHIVVSTICSGGYRTCMYNIGANGFVVVLSFVVYGLELRLLAHLCKKNSVASVRKRTIPTEGPPPVGEVSANFCG